MSDPLDDLSRMYSGNGHEGAIPIVSADNLDLEATVEHLRQSLEDVQGFAAGACAGCGRTGRNLLKDSVGVWCQDCGGAGIADGPLPEYLRPTG